MPQKINSAVQQDVWEQAGWVWTALFLLGIVLGLIFAAQSEAWSGSTRWLIIGLSILLGVWHLASLIIARRIGHFRASLPFALLHIGGLTLIWFALIRIHPAFYITQMGLWSQIFIALPIAWAIVFAFLLFGINLYQQSYAIGAALDWPIALLWFGITVIGAFFGLWIHSIISQSIERKQLIRELEETRAELAQSEREAGRLQERERLAREIHDTLAQGFTSIVMNLEAAEQALPTDLDTLRHHLDTARRTARLSLEQAREVVQDLRPDLLTQQTLPEALVRVAARWSGETGVEATAVTTGIVLPLHPEIEVTLLRAVQEALANVHKHANARTVQITLSYMGDIVMLDVQDDGVGLNGAAPSPLTGGFGLTAMRERVTQLGGALDVESEPNAGTTIAISIPVLAPPQHPQPVSGSQRTDL